jgi:hypothetical protein
VTGPSALSALLLEIVAFDGEPSPSAPIVFRRRPRSHFPAGPEGDRTWSMWNSKYAGRPAGVTSADGRVRMMLNGRSVDTRAVVEELLAALNGNGLASGGTCSGTPATGGTSPDPAVVSSEGANGGGTSPGTLDSGGTSSEEPSGGEYGGYEEIGDGPLGRAILAAARKTGLALADLTAMRRDPYRRDTTSGHRNGRWFKLWWERYGAPPGREKMLPGSDRVEEWLGAYGGLEQTEVDAAIAIKPDELRGWIALQLVLAIAVAFSLGVLVGRFWR